MDEVNNPENTTSYGEGSTELNGNDSSFRNAPMISAPRTIPKMRIRGALVPWGSFK